METNATKKHAALKVHVQISHRCPEFNCDSTVQVDEIAKPLASTKEEIFADHFYQFVLFISLMIGNREVVVFNFSSSERHLFDHQQKLKKPF